MSKGNLYTPQYAEFIKRKMAEEGPYTPPDPGLRPATKGDLPSAIAGSKAQHKASPQPGAYTITKSAPPTPTMISLNANYPKPLDASNLDPRTRKALQQLDRISVAKSSDEDLARTIEQIDSVFSSAQRAAMGDPKRRILSNELHVLAINAMIRKICKAPLGDDHKVYLRAIGEDSTPGSAYITARLGSDIYDALASQGAWATLGVRIVRSKTGRFPVFTAVPNAQFILAEGDSWSDDTAMTGASVSAETEVCGILMNASVQLMDDMEADLAPDFVEKFERGMNKRLDHACFSGTGDADADNGGMTGLFVNNTISRITAANGNTTVQTLDYEDFLACLEASADGVLQRDAHWWMNPSLLVRAMRVKDAAGASIVQTALDRAGTRAFSILGYPVNLVASAPSTNVAGSIVAIFGEPDGYIAGVRQGFTFESSGDFLWNAYQRSFRAVTRFRGELRSAAAFVALKTAAA